MRGNNENFVAVTGIGMICPLGITTAECWENMTLGKSGIRRITRFDASKCLTQIAGEIPDQYFKMEKGAFPQKVYKRTSLPSRLTLLSARQAIEDGRIDFEEIGRDRVAVFTGSSGSTSGDQMMDDQGNFGKQSMRKSSFSYEMLSCLSAWVSKEFRFKGPSLNISTACASGAFAIGFGYDYVRRSGDPCVAIGIDTMVLKETIDGFNQLIALSEENRYPEKASRPFDKKRNGFVISEGACAVLLEPYAHAVRRVARIYAVMSGYACTSEAYNIVAPEPEGREIAKTMELAIQNAKIPKHKIGYINAHGTSTPHNDLIETRGIKMVFGEEAYKIPVSSQKSMIGHTLGAAGAIAFAVTALTLYHQLMTPTINYEEPDPECDLDYVPNKARKTQLLEAAMTNSFGFGGHNCSIVLEKDNSIPRIV